MQARLNNEEVRKIIVPKMNRSKSGKKTAANKIMCDDIKIRKEL